ncbi:MAG: class I SAM-dependent methyltransferase [Gorillibacterium sp.]|nr:class I SAM-dependent methyltransferase [Gorillibacterium sp.]
MAYGRFASYYDRLMEDMPYAEWLAFLDECWVRYGHKPKSIADLGCGTGSLTIPLAERGFHVAGIDLSEDMLAVAQMKSESSHKGFISGSTTWLQQDMREWMLPSRVDAAISLCDCLNYLTEESDIAAAFRSTWEGLEPGGLFIFDVHTPYQLQNYAKEQPFILNEEDIAYIWYCDLDEATLTLEHELTIFAREKDDHPLKMLKSERFLKVEEIHVQRAYPLSWLEDQLLEAGFSRVDKYADFRFESPRENTERAFFVAVK